MSWSDDYTLLNKDCEANEVSCFSKKRFFDARDVVKLLRGRAANGLDKEIKNYDIDVTGLRRHRALDDSIITAKLLKELNLRNKGWKV